MRGVIVIDSIVRPEAVIGSIQETHLVRLLGNVYDAFAVFEVLRDLLQVQVETVRRGFVREQSTRVLLDLCDSRARLVDVGVAHRLSKCFDDFNEEIACHGQFS